MATPSATLLASLPDSHRNTPLAPSQEIAYRQKCIQLKRRLLDIETNNDKVRQRLSHERRFQDKMRLNRAILLDHMRELVEDPMNQHSDEQIQAARESGGYVRGYDDMTDASSDEHIVEPEERPVRIKRARDGTPRKSGGTKTLSSDQHSALASGPAYRTIDGHVDGTSTSLAFDTRETQPRDARLGPTPIQQHPDGQQTLESASPTGQSSPQSLSGPPDRPLEPFKQFTDHLRPQLVNDNIPPANIGAKIEETWQEIGPEGQGPWQEKYNKEMMFYQSKMDEYKRSQRASKLVNGTGSSFSAANK